MKNSRTPSAIYLDLDQAKQDREACFDGLTDDYTHFVKCLPYNNKEGAWCIGATNEKGLIEACFDRDIFEFTEEQFIRASEIWYATEDAELIYNIIFKK